MNGALKNTMASNGNDTDYAIISPCRNEQEFMRKTLDSVVEQTIKPKVWVIVDDGSTDKTPEILKEYASKHDFIEVVTRQNRGARSVGPGVIDAFYDGFGSIDIDDYRYICKLDLDLILPSRYFELVIKEMQANSRLGTFSGKAYFIDKKTDAQVSEGCGDESSIGAAKFYRVSCFKQIGGFVRQVMWDGIDSHRCRLLGWESASIDDEETRFVHLRPMGSSQKGILTGRARHGFGQYFMGTGAVYMIAASIYRLKHPPYVVGSLATLWGYFSSLFKRVDKLDDPGMVRMMRRYHWLSMLMGKRRATAYLNKKNQDNWDPEQEAYDIPV